MKTLFKAAALAVTMSGALAGAALADPVLGTWQTVKDDNGNYGHISVAACGAAICGTLVKSFDSAGKAFKSANQGRKIIWDMRAEGGGAYSGGKVYSPDRDKTYSAKMTLAGSNLKIKGCVLGICRDGGTWKRVN